MQRPRAGDPKATARAARRRTTQSAAGGVAAARAAAPEFGSDVIVDLLRAQGIEYVALNPGATFRGLHDSLVNYGGNRAPEIIMCTHEEISVAIAHGYAKAAGKPMAAAVHNIVGLQHATAAIFNAWCDRVPILVYGGTGPMDTSRRRPWIDWIHTALVQGNAIRDIVKWDDQPHTLASVPASMIRAYRVAMTEPRGPVYVCFDAEMQESPIDRPPPLPSLARFAPPAPPQAEAGALREAARLLADAEQPVLITDFSGRHPESLAHLVALAEFLGAPLLDRGNRMNFPTTHPLNLTGANAKVLAAADVLLALDVQDLFGALRTTDKQTRQTRLLLPDSARVIHVTLEHLAIKSWAADFQELQAVDLPIAADTSVALPALLEELRRAISRNSAWETKRDRRAAHWRREHAALRRGWRQQLQATWDERPISVPRLAHEVWEVVKGEDWVIANGELAGWAQRLWEWTQPHHYLGRSGGGGLGYGIGAAIGAALAHRGGPRLCLDLQADGDLLYTASGLWTVAKHGLPLLIVMHNNRSYYNSEEHAEEVALARDRNVAKKGIGTVLDDPCVDFATLARSFSVHGIGPIEAPEALRPALEEALRVVKEGRAALVDVVTQAR